MKNKTPIPFIPWSEARTFDDWIIKMIEEKKTDDPGFQAALAFHGRERLGEIWKTHQAKREGIK